MRATNDASVATVGRQGGESTDEVLAIERHFPELHGRLARVRCTTLPTRVHRLQRMGAHLGIDQLWVKRDDESGALYGGNKPRKLEFLLGAARAERKAAVLTVGGIGTHHGLATAIYARAAGLRTILLLLQQPVTEHVRRCLLLDSAAGAELYCASTVLQLAVRGLGVCARELLRGQLPYIIPTGGTTALGILGYVNAAIELRAQIAAGEMPEPDWIFVPMGSGGTVAGLVLGAKLIGLRSRIAAVLVTDILPPTAERLAKLATKSQALLRQWSPQVPSVPLLADDFAIISGYVGPAYGAPTEAACRARDVMAQMEGIHLDTTYTAKCAAAMIDAACTSVDRGSCVLFWNTYSSVDPAMHLGPLPPYQQLPHSFHRFFTGAAVPA